MRTIRYMATVALAAMAISSCDEDTMTIGQSLTNNSDKLDVEAESFAVTTRTILADSVFAMAGDCYLGQVKDPETGAVVRSAFTTQFHVLENTYLSPEERIAARTADGRAAADSCQLILYLASPFRSSDSLTAMKLCVDELSQPLAEGVRYYTSFSPAEAGLLRNGGLHKTKMFSYRNTTDTDSARASSNYLENISISLNLPYTDRQGTTYNNYGTYIMQQFYDHPEHFANSFTFAHEVCPGMYVDITDGLGFHAQVTDIGLRTFYTVTTDSTELHAALTLAGTSEVLKTTHIANDRATLEAMAAETQHTYVKSPAGLFTEVTLPVDDIMRGHETDTLIAADLTFQRLNNQTTDSRYLGTPQTLLLVQKDSLYTFFENNSVTDDITSYYATYSSTYNTYSFTNISNLITELWRRKTLDPDLPTRDPDWNKMVLVPVTYTTSTTTGTTVTSIQHDLSLTSARLVGGPDNPNGDILVNVIFAKFNNH